MSQSRIATALSDGLSLPDGPINVIRPPMTADLTALQRDRVRVIHTIRPDFDGWAAYGPQTDITPASVAVIHVPRSKALARGLIAGAGAPFVLVDGQRTDGVDSLWRDVRDRVGDVPCITKGHGRLFWFTPGDAFADWALPGPQRQADGLFSQPGVFAESGPDAGSVMLAAALPARLPARMADLGAGTGFLARAVLQRDTVQSLDLIEAEKLALDCAQLGVTDPRATFHWADATRHDPRAPWDGVVMNPPFHAGRAADPGIGRAFIAAARRGLSPQGQLWMVANRHLPYEADLQAGFRDLTVIGGDGSYKLFHAARPKR
jgi:16S rRNA (guanine1207-N2)-methyltransferase